jgi:hypothetical protein
MKHLKEHFCRLLACLMLCAAPLAANAVVVFDNGPPNHESGNNMGFAWQADDFTICACQPINGVTFWSLEAEGAYRGSISWSIVRDLGGPELASGTQTMVTRTSLGTYLGLNEYRNEFTFDTALKLAAGTYWLVLHNGSFSNMGDPNEFLWETANGNASALGMESFDGVTWTPNFNQHAFVISAVPEPGQLAMLMAGLIVAGSLRRREQRSAKFVR